jgi:hypothetical protein
MIIGSIILVISVLYFLIRILNKIDSTNNSGREKDGSMNLSVSIDYVKGELKTFDFESVQCPDCGCEYNNLNWFEFRTSDHSWDHLAGREGFYAKCPACNIVVFDFVTKLN